MFPIVIFLLLLVVTVVLMPVLMNVQKYVPEIEKRISKASGRSFSIGSDVTVSFFPWLSLSFSDLKLGNPEGFVSDALVKIDHFEARLKLLPLLKKEIRISRFVVGGLEVNLEKNSDGKVNWEPLSRAAASRVHHLQDSIFCSLLAVTDGRVNWIDRTNHTRHAVEDLMLLLNNVQGDHPIAIDFNASYDGMPVAVEGEIGPLRQKEGGRVLPVDFDFRFIEKLHGQVRGKMENQRSAPVYDVALKLSSFSPRALFAALDLAFPVETADPASFQAVELEMAIKGGREKVTVEKGTLRLDDTSMSIAGEVKNMREVNFSLDIDRLDLDRYLPPRDSRSEKVDREYAGIIHRIAGNNPASLVGVVKLENLRILGRTVTGIEANLGGREGVFTLDKATMQFYGGQMQANLTADLSAGVPTMRLAVQSQGVDAAAVLRESDKQEILSGILKSDLALEFSGDTAEAMRKSLSGMGSFVFIDGALHGIDIPRSIESRELVKADQEGDRQSVRTDFTELKGGFAIDDGLLTIREAILNNSDKALFISGGADIPDGVWDLRVAPQQMVLPKPTKGKQPLSLAISGPFLQPELNLDDRRQPSGTVKTVKTNVASLIDEKIPSPVEEDVKGLVGKTLIDPAVVAQRFHLQRETIRRSETKKQLRLGSGKILIHPLLEETSLYQKPDARGQKPEIFAPKAPL